MLSTLKSRLCILVLALLIQACAGTVSTRIKESDKDPNASFDGNYIAIVDHPGGKQELGSGWFGNCGPQEFQARFVVRNSEVLWQFDEETFVSGFVDKAGRFRLEHLLESEATSSTTVLSDGSTKFILQGVIEEDVMKGMLVFGVAQFNYQGCSYPVEYQLVADTSV